jgi:hypothetical protein
MIISHKHKFAYFHNPKCAGTSIGNTIANKWELSNNDIIVGEYGQPAPSLVNDPSSIFYKQKHITISNLNEIYSGDISGYYKFGFVRNPYDIAVSWYKFWFKWKGGSVNNQPAYNNWLKIQHMNFSEFVRCKWFNNIATPADYFLCDATNKLLVDFVGKFENLQQDFDIICDEIKIPKQKLPHKNKSNHKHYTEYYDDETRQIIAKKYAKDIKYFNYEFTG